MFLPRHCRGHSHRVPEDGEDHVQPLDVYVFASLSQVQQEGGDELLAADVVFCVFTCLFSTSSCRNTLCQHVRLPGLVLCGCVPWGRLRPGDALVPALHALFLCLLVQTAVRGFQVRHGHGNQRLGGGFSCGERTFITIYLLFFLYMTF